MQKGSLLDTRNFLAKAAQLLQLLREDLARVQATYIIEHFLGTTLKRKTGKIHFNNILFIGIEPKYFSMELILDLMRYFTSFFVPSL